MEEKRNCECSEENGLLSHYLTEPAQEISDEILPILQNSKECEKRRVKIVELIPTQKTINYKRLNRVKDDHKPIIVMQDGDELKIVDGHHRTIYNYLEGEEDIKAKVFQSQVIAEAYSRKKKKTT